ncbi:MAG: monovalent cation/H+ antiporter subunit D family protein [Gammaproteobacteria bacterium]|nr:monovalent cation/H+ antiporter subunit D family protein [Gammaproteobacteria bacterium]
MSVISPQLTIVLAVAVPLIGAVLIWMSHGRPNQREAVSLMTAGILFAFVASLLPGVLDGDRPAAVLWEILPGLPLAFRVEPLGLLFALVASFLWIVTTVYSIGYMRGHREANQTRFYICFAIALSSTMGIAFAGNMFTLFVFYEVLTLSTYPLVTHAGTREAKRGGRVYLGVLLGTSIGFLLLAVVWTWSLTGTLDFREGGILRDAASPPIIGALFALYVFGIGKAAIMPFHRWLPAAMVAPTPVSALLHAVAVVKAGVFTVLKVSIYIFGIDLLAEIPVTEWLAYVAGATILIASLVALAQDNLKLRLAYSTVSQLSYVILGALLANPLGVVGGAMHIVMHAFGKITLFFCAGAIIVATHKTRVSEMHGLGRTMPLTMTAFFIGSLSVIGLPPMGGLWSKWYLALGTLDAGQIGLLAVLMLSSLLNLAYLLPITILAFFGTPDKDLPDGGIREAPPACVAALLLTALGCLVLFVYPEPLYQLTGLIIPNQD